MFATRRAISWDAVKRWRAGKHPLPIHAAETLRDAIHRRCETGLQLVSELDSYILERERIPPRTAGRLKGHYRADE
jgi:hypothetical protein